MRSSASQSGTGGGSRSTLWGDEESKQILGLITMISAGGASNVAPDASGMALSSSSSSSSSAAATASSSTAAAMIRKPLQRSTSITGSALAGGGLGNGRGGSSVESTSAPAAGSVLPARLPLSSSSSFLGRGLGRQKGKAAKPKVSSSRRRVRGFSFRVDSSSSSSFSQSASISGLDSSSSGGGGEGGAGEGSSTDMADMPEVGRMLAREALSAGPAPLRDGTNSRSSGIAAGGTAKRKAAARWSEHMAAVAKQRPSKRARQGRTSKGKKKNGPGSGTLFTALRHARR